MNVQYFLQNKIELCVLKVIISFFLIAVEEQMLIFILISKYFFPLKIASPKSFPTIITKTPAHAELMMVHEDDSWKRSLPFPKDMRWRDKAQTQRRDHHLNTKNSKAATGFSKMQWMDK